MKLNVSPKIYTILGTYARAFVAAVVTAYTIGAKSPKDLLAAGVASLLPVIMRWANPTDSFPEPSKGLKAADAVVMNKVNP